MRTATIYSIVDSVTREVKYVGSTLLPFNRRRAGKYSKPVELWMATCTPEFCVLETCPASERAAREQYWIDRLTSEGAMLLNKVVAQIPLAHETEPVKLAHPSESNAARRKRGGWRLEVWLPEEYRVRLDALCEDSGFSRADQIMGLIDAETDGMARIRSRQQSKIKRGMRAVGQR